MNSVERVDGGEIMKVSFVEHVKVEIKKASLELLAVWFKPWWFSTHVRSAVDEGEVRYLPGFLESNNVGWKHK